MAAPQNLPIDPWPIDTSGCEFAEDLPCSVDMLVSAVSEMLYSLSGRRFGVRSIGPIRPCRDGCADYPVWWETVPYSWGGYRLLPIIHTCSPHSCSCSVIHEIKLQGPVSRITEVKVDGEVLDPAAYRVDDWKWLVRVDGESWPTCQDINLGDDELGTWSVTYTRGRPIPTGGILAGQELVCNLGKALAGQDCDLPGNVTSVSRQGVTQTFKALYELLETGHTGLPFTDFWLNDTNPERLTRRPRVLSATDVRPRRIGT